MILPRHPSTTMCSWRRLAFSSSHLATSPRSLTDRSWSTYVTWNALTFLEPLPASPSHTFAPPHPHAKQSQSCLYKSRTKPPPPIPIELYIVVVSVGRGHLQLMLGFSGLVYLGLFLTLVLPLMFRVITKCSAGAIAYRASVKVLQYNVDMCIGADGGSLFCPCVMWFGVVPCPTHAAP